MVACWIGLVELLMIGVCGMLFTVGTKALDGAAVKDEAGVVTGAVIDG